MQNTKIIKLTREREAVTISALTFFAVATPLLIHQFGKAPLGQIILPLHFFVLLAGLAFGWRAGIATGVASVLVSFLISGMPALDLLPFILLEVSAYGLFAGLLREKHNLKIWTSLAISLIAGRLIMLASLSLFSQTPATAYAISALKTGWPGIMLQIALLPIGVNLLLKYLQNEKC